MRTMEGKRLDEDKDKEQPKVFDNIKRGRKTEEWAWNTSDWR